MPASFIAELTCDHHPRCTSTARVGVSTEMDRGCSPFGGPACSAEIVADTYGTGWHEFPGGKMCCPLCWEKPCRFDLGYKP